MTKKIKSIITLLVWVGSSYALQAKNVFLNDSTTPKQKHRITYKDVQSRARDHLMMQFGYVGWANKPDTVPLGGFGRQFKIYGMYDFNIHGFPYMSVALGLGVAWDNVYFNNAYVDISNTNNNQSVRFTSSTRSYDKNKITTFYIDAPIELRFTTNPRNYNKGLKFNVGVTYGLLMSAYTKGVKLYENGSQIDDSKYKVVNSNFFNSSHIVLTTKIGWGFVYVYANYQLTTLFSSGKGPSVNPFAIGIGIAGL